MTTQETNPYTSPQSELTNAEYGEAKAFSFSGRIGRLRYLAYSMGLMLLVSIVGSLLIGLTAGFTPQGDAGPGPLAVVMMVVVYGFTIVASVVLAVRRLNDFDASGWLVLLFLVPLVNFILSLVLWFKPGTNGTNRYGLQPPENSGGVTALAMVLPLIMIIGILAAIAIPQYAEYQQRAAAMQSQ